jgi:glycosyltransferase involved in cell wall biosynthesis
MTTRVLVWQWGRFGAGPKIAVALADALRALPDTQVALSLSEQAEILTGAAPPICELPVPTYSGILGLVWRMIASPWTILTLRGRLRALRPEVAICAMPGPIDLLMIAALRPFGTRSVIMVHDADAHPGDGLPLQMWLQRLLCRRASAVASLSTHVGRRLRDQNLLKGDLIALTLPPLGYDVPPAQPHDGPLRLLHFGRLLPYKGLDLLAGALAGIDSLTVRVVGSGPESAELDALRALPNMTVENRWVPEDEVGSLLGWADALILPYREASQSGVAAAALAAGRAVVSTNVGGLAEQLKDSDRALLCEPTVEGLRAAIMALLDGRIALAATGEDPGEAWRTMAASLLRQIALPRG